MSYKVDYDRWLNAPYESDSEKKTVPYEETDFFDLDFESQREDRTHD